MKNNERKPEIQVPSEMIAKTGMEEKPHHVVVLSDVHLPGGNLEGKEKVIEDINSWETVDMTTVLGDIVETYGSEEQYAFAKAFLGKLDKPLKVVAGNHEYIYVDGYLLNEETGCHLKETRPDMRKKKLDRYKRTWELDKTFYSERLGNYLLVFLTVDNLYTQNYTEMSFCQLRWLDDLLRDNRETPTIIFFHGPLKGTYSDKRINKRNPDSNDAEPSGIIKEILRKNRQVFLWVAGHKHIRATAEDYASEINLYDDHIWVIHNSTWALPPEIDTFWTNSLFLYPDHVKVRTYDHKKKDWIKQLDRSFSIRS